MDLCEAQEPGFASLREETESLAPYAVEIRYPGDAPEISVDEARRAVAGAEAVWDFVFALFPQHLQLAMPAEEDGTE